jgi:hypothetical protein
MTYESVKRVSSLALGLCLAASAAACSRDNIEAINMANIADKSLKVNVEGAIQKYEEATRLDPSNHLIFWKLSNAYQKKEDWDKMASTWRARPKSRRSLPTTVQARLASCKRRSATSTPMQREGAAAKCIERIRITRSATTSSGPRTSDRQRAAALDNWTKAIEHIRVGYFYPPLADTLISPGCTTRRAPSCGRNAHHPADGRRVEEEPLLHVRPPLDGEPGEG